MVCLVADWFSGGWEGSRTHSLFRTWEMLGTRRKWGGVEARGGGARNNAGLEKLKKRARRAAITSDVSRPNDRHLSPRGRCYAKSSLPLSRIGLVVKVINKLHPLRFSSDTLREGQLPLLRSMNISQVCGTFRNL